jgi:endonuclease V-like protein UPF0215 family
MLVNLFNIEMPDSQKLDQALNDKFISKEKFAEEIESIVQRTSMNHIDAIVEFCEEKGIEIESVSKLVSRPLKEKIKFEAQELNYLKKTSKGKLPL